MIKRVVGQGTLVLVVVLLLTGCSSPNIRLSESDEDVIAAYAADLMLKYDADYTQSVLSTPKQAAQKERTGEAEFPEDMSTVDPSQTEESENAESAERTEQKTGAEGTNSLSSQFAGVTYTKDLSAVFSLKGLRVVYQDYQLVSTYPKEKDAFGVVYAKANHQLLVLKIKLTNTESKVHRYHLMEADIPYCLYWNNEKIVSPMMTLLPLDLSTYSGSIPAKQSKTAVLLFELTNAQCQNIQSLKLGAGKGDRIAYVQLK